MAKITNVRLGEYLQKAFRIAIKYGDFYPIREIIKEMEEQMVFNEYETEILKSNGLARWQNYMYFWSINATKAGWLRKHKGVWQITKEGKKALELNPDIFIKVSSEKFQEWKKSKDLIREKEKVETDEDTIEVGYEQAQVNAREEIKEFVRKFNHYEFQDLVAALFRGMGYYTPFIAPKGPDGGIDIVAYKDPIGAELPRIRVQVKHRIDTKVSSQEVDSLLGNLQGDGYVGIIVSTGGFSTEAMRKLSGANKHIEKIDLDRFIDLWEEYYDKLSDEDKQLLPLRKISFLAPEK